MTHIAYPKLEPLSKHRDILKEGSFITIREKLDGANASVRMIDGKVVGASRKRIVTSDFRGFPEWIQVRYEDFEEFFNRHPSLIIYGEWLVQHRVKYKEECQKIFYVFDVFDINTQRFVHQREVEKITDEIVLSTAPIIWWGTIEDPENIQQLIKDTCGTSYLTEEPNTGEGVVVYNPDYIDSFGRNTRCKLVSERFAESKSTKMPRPQTGEYEISADYVTQARVIKCALKLGPKEELSRSNTGDLIGSVTHDIFEECMLDISKKTPTINFKPFKKAIAEQSRKIFFSWLDGEIE